MTDGLHLAPRHRELLVSLLREHVPGVEVWAYGSRVNGRSHDGSDLDLVLRGPELKELPIEQLMDLEEALRESRIPFLVEARDWARLPERFQRKIERRYVVLTSSFDLDISGAWKLTTIGECAELNPETITPNTHSYIQYLDTANIKQNRIGHLQHLVPGRDKIPSRARRTAKLGDVLYSTVRPNQRHFGILSDVPRNFVASTGFTVIRGRRDIADSAFLYWFLTQDAVVNHLQVIAEHSTSTYPSIRPIDIETLTIKLPKLSEQRAIARILGALDDKIELNRRMNETLEAMARALFKSWFVDFDPVRAKMEGRDTGLPQEIADLFPDRLVDSDLGEIPEGWTVLSLDDIARFQNGLALQKFRPAKFEARLPVIKIAQMRTGEANSGEWSSAAIRPDCIVENGDVLFSWSGSLLVTVWTGGRAALNQHLFKVTSKKYPKWFYLHSLLSHLEEFRRTAQDKATTMGHIRRHHLAEALCAAPPDSTVVGAADMFSLLLEQSTETKLTVRHFAALRDTLLPKLMSGEIRVPEAEERIRAAD